MVAAASAQSQILSAYTMHRKKVAFQLACTISAVAIPIILSLGGTLPAIVWKVGAVVLCAFPIKMMIASLLHKLSSNHHTSTQYAQELIKVGPLQAGLCIPIIEESLFRGVLQGGLTLGLRKIIPTTLVSLFSTPIFLSTCLAAIVASTAFGLAHAQQSPIQALITGLGSLALEAPLFHLYGLWAACLAHIVNNTLCYLFMVVSWEASRRT